MSSSMCTRKQEVLHLKMNSIAVILCKAIYIPTILTSIGIQRIRQMMTKMGAN